MIRIGSLQELHAMREKLVHREDDAVRTITLCGGTGCTALGSLQVYEAFEQEIRSRGLEDRIKLKRTGCHGFCEQGPVLVILPERFFYPGVQVEDVPEILERTALGGKVIRRLCYVDPVSGRRIAHEHDVPFYKEQTRLVFRHNGELDPLDLDDYIARDGYAALAKALEKMRPEQVIEEVKLAGLRGRGGAGFPTGVKWELCRKSPGDEKYLICNADEGDPGAFMDRSLLEGTPHAIIEGMTIAGYAIGAQTGMIYVRAEYPLAVQNVKAALQQAHEAGLLGDNILGSGFSFSISVHEGAGAFVCGEETALIASLEGKRGMPRPRPPFPAESGYRGKPSNINNVETLANIPLIILKGHKWYASIGTEGSKGTKIFALAGKVNNTGLVEVPMGTTLRHVIFDIGGGIPRGRKFKAAQIGGPSGGCVPARYLDLPIDYDSVKQIGAIMGSGGLIVMDEATCMVDVARFFTDFVQQESCGKCVPCRVGTKRMLEILTRITMGEGELADIDRLERLGRMIQRASLCGLGQTAPNPVLSTIRHFRDEYEAHIIEKRCPANSCEALITTTCRSACPAHVNVPEYVSLIAEGRFADSLEVIRRRNPFASVCGRACNHPCELFCRRGDVDAPVAIRHLKRFVADRARDVGQPRQWQGPREGKVAIVGSGPAGLTAAYFLALMGRGVKVFEASDVVGGVLALGIPSYRIPKDALARDIEYIRRAGVEMETDHRVESVQDLRDAGFDAIFVAVGAHKDMRLGIPGEDMDGVHHALTFLRQVAQNKITGLHGPVAVIGAGNAAIDSARTALRLGASLVTVLYRRTEAEMPAIREEIEEALLEGVDFHYLVAPVEIEGDGHVERVRCAEMELGEADESGRRRPVPKPGAEMAIEAEHVIIAIGEAPDVECAACANMVALAGTGIAGDVASRCCEEKGVFVGGDAATGPGTIIEAIAAGQRAAQAIDIYLGGKGELPLDEGFAGRSKPTEEEADIPRHPVRALPAAKRRGGFDEVLKGYSARTAQAEARRCLRCDLE